MGNTFAWYPAATSGDFSSGGSWIENGTVYPAGGPPGGGDDASIVAYNPFPGHITVSGSGSAYILSIAGLVTFDGASITGVNEIILGGGSPAGLTNSLTLTGATTLDGPGSGGVGSEFFGTLDIEGSSTVNGYSVQIFGTLLDESGLVKATQFTAGSFSDPSAGFLPGSIDVASGGSIDDTTGIVGLTVSDQVTMTIGGGAQWTNQGLGIGSAGNVTLTVSGGATISTGGGAAFPGGPALLIGGTANGAGTAVTITGPIPRSRMPTTRGSAVSAPPRSPLRRAASSISAARSTPWCAQAAATMC